MPPGTPGALLLPPSEKMIARSVPLAWVSDWNVPFTITVPFPKGEGTLATNDLLATEGPLLDV